MEGKKSGEEEKEGRREGTRETIGGFLFLTDSFCKEGWELRRRGWTGERVTG